jgi:transcriptional regulator with XRE-family HTH domain
MAQPDEARERRQGVFFMGLDFCMRSCDLVNSVYVINLGASTMQKIFSAFANSPLWALLRLLDVELMGAAKRLGVAKASLTLWQNGERNPMPHLLLFLTEIARAELEHKEQCLTLTKEEAERALDRKLSDDWQAVGLLQCEVGRKLLALQDQRNDRLRPDLRAEVIQWSQSTPFKKRHQGLLRKDIEKIAKKYPTRRGGRPKKTQTENGAQAA